MPSFRARDGADRVIESVTPESLRAFLTDSVDFVVFDCPEWGDQTYAQAATESDGRWIVEVRDGGNDRHWKTTAPNLDATYDIMRSWANGDYWWRSAFDWELLDLG